MTHSYVRDGTPVGFFTDPTVCIGCKACEVACKEWNGLPADGMQLSGMSYDNTRALSATSWRHVSFVEQNAGSSERRSSGVHQVRYFGSGDFWGGPGRDG